MIGLVQKMQSSAIAMARGGATCLGPRRFMAREDGTVTAFAVILFVLMVGASGIAIDVMRYETQRTQLQQTLDRAVLAAAAEDALTGDPRAVVEDYFAVAGIEGYRLDVRVETVQNARRVHAYAELEVRSMFMQLFGVPVMTSPAIGAAEQGFQRMEISLVLDFSLSMGAVDAAGVSRLDRLRTATDTFLNEIFAAGILGETSISFVPYAGTVNPGRHVFEAMGGQRNTLTYDDAAGNPLFADGTQTEVDILGNTYTFADGDPLLDLNGDPLTRFREPMTNHCLEYTALDYASDSVPLPSTYAQVTHAAEYPDAGNPEKEWGWCPNSRTVTGGLTAQEITYFARTPAQIQDLLDETHMYHGTGTDIAMMWGLWLLDPASNWLVRDLVAEGVVPSELEDRPAPYNDSSTLKIIVLMTDGAITGQFRPRFPDRTDIGATEMDDVWLNYTVQSQLQNSSQCNGLDCTIAFQNVTQAESNFQSLCDRARANGITVFTIAVDTSDTANDQMRACAGGDANFFEVTAGELEDAFLAIAGSVQRLRLIQ